ncbi:MAG: hypothetical protein JWO73_478 [Candidatus Taylorbacteria bacterium]|nr:hypothetical protein [Candidatus Taylorbacteria bacterium]
MTIHETIKNQIKDAMRAKDSVRLDVLRGLTAAFSNEIITKGAALAPSSTAGVELINDESALALIKRSVKQHKDSIDQFDKGGRKDLSDKERAELVILDTFVPAGMSQDDIRKLAEAKIAGLPGGKLEKPMAGKFMGELMREIKAKGIAADGADVKSVIDSLVS